MKRATFHRLPSTSFAFGLGCVAMCAVLSMPAHAQFKIVGPDGKVTYSDRPASSEGAKVTHLQRPTVGEESGASALSLELRQLSQKYPVTLYTATDCGPCSSARQLLSQRGIPYREKTVVTEDDVAALERLVGGRSVPSLTVGSQALRGLASNEWNSYLDAAGYPSESRLPKSWQAPTPEPLTARTAAKPAQAAAAPPRSTTRTAEVPVASPNAVRF